MSPPCPSSGPEHSLVFPNRSAGVLSPNIWRDLKGHICCCLACPEQCCGSLLCSWSVSPHDPPNPEQLSDRSAKGLVLPTGWVWSPSSLPTHLVSVLIFWTSLLLPLEQQCCHVLDLWLLLFFPHQQYLNFLKLCFALTLTGLNLSRARSIGSFSMCDPSAGRAGVGEPWAARGLRGGIGVLWLVDTSSLGNFLSAGPAVAGSAAEEESRCVTVSTITIQTFRLC